MERTDLYFAHKYELNPVTYCVHISDVGRSDIREIVKDTENCRISIYGHIHGHHLLTALELLFKMKGYKPTDVVTIKL